jgi:hypothetical protein
MSVGVFHDLPFAFDLKYLVYHVVMIHASAVALNKMKFVIKN